MMKRVDVPLDEFRPAPATVLRVSKRNSALACEGVANVTFGCRIPRLGESEDDGVYGGWSADDSRVEAYTDRYGLWPIFYHFDGTNLCLSDTILGVLGKLKSPPSLDSSSMAVFLRLGWFFGEDTPFCDVRTLPPNGRLTWNGSELTVTGSRIALCGPVQTNFEDAIEEYISLFKRAVRRQLEHAGAPEAMLLSGGRDSRFILLALNELGAKPKVCISSGVRTDSDVRTAEVVAKRISSEHHVLEIPRPSYLWARRNYRATNLCTEGHTWFVPAFIHLGRLTDVAFDGIAGDVLAGGGVFLTEKQQRLAEEKNWSALANELTTRCRGEPIVSRICELLGMKNDFSAFHDGAVAEFSLGDADLSPVTSFFFWTRTRRAIALAPYALGRSVSKMMSPFLDRDLVQFLSSIPAAWRSGKGFHDAAIARAFPEFRDVPYAQGLQQRNCDTLWEGMTMRLTFLRDVMLTSGRISPLNSRSLLTLKGPHAYIAELLHVLSRPSESIDRA